MLLDVASHQNQHWSVFSYDGIVRLTARSTKLTEQASRTALLHLQQRLIDDLPDHVDVDLVNDRILGDVICIGMWENGPTKRFVRVSPDEKRVHFAPNQHVPWKEYSYESILELLIKCADAARH